jgi:hypothetical protein
VWCLLLSGVLFHHFFKLKHEILQELWLFVPTVSHRLLVLADVK